MRLRTFLLGATPMDITFTIPKAASTNSALCDSGNEYEQEKSPPATIEA
jgi:hypothetical protein